LEISDDDPLTQHPCRRYRRRICLGFYCIILAGFIIYQILKPKEAIDDSKKDIEVEEDIEVKPCYYNSTTSECY
jgi:hypothetical protein